MTDIFDRASEREQRDRDSAIEHARSTPSHRNGPELCVKCGDENDRMRAGFAVCTRCVVAARV